MSNIHIALASQIDFNQARWAHSPLTLYNDVGFEADRLVNLVGAMVVTDFQAFIDQVVLPYGKAIDNYLMQEHRSNLQPMAEELGKLAFAFDRTAGAAIYKCTGYNAPHHQVATDAGKLVIHAPCGTPLGAIYGTGPKTRELANKIAAFLDTQP